MNPTAHAASRHRILPAFLRTPLRMVTRRRAIQIATFLAAFLVVSCDSTSSGEDGTLQVTIAGIGGTPAAVQVTGPAGFSRALTASATITGVVPGSYQLAATPVGSGAQSYRPVTSSQTVEVSGGATTRASVFYRLAAELVVVVIGLPQDLPASVQVSGHQGTVTSPTTSLVLDPGTHTVTAGPVTSAGGTWNPTAIVQNVTLAGGTTTTVTVSYQSVPGQAQVTVTGLPVGFFPAGTISGPGGYTASVTAIGTNTFGGLVPGTYTVAFQTVVVNGNGWTATPATANLTVTSGGVALANAVYAATTGSLSVTITGLGGTLPAAVTVSGPGGFTRTLTASAVLTELVPGDYLVSGQDIPNDGNPFVPSPATQTVAVAAGVRAGAAVQYRPLSTLAITVDGVQINQVAQTYAGNVPLVTGRPGLLRVFLKANETNTARPDVRARFYNGATLVQSFTIPAPGAATPQTVTEEALNASWNLEVPGTLLQPGMRLLIDVDPAATIPVVDRGTLRWPLSGNPQALDVRAGPSYNLTFVPVTHLATGLTGDVTLGNAEDFLGAFRRLHPVAGYDVQVHAPIAFTGGALNSPDSGPWIDLLEQIEDLRVLEGSARYYYGVVKVVSPTWSGFGFVPDNPAINDARTSVGWDQRDLPLLGASQTFAHELGHNVGLSHAPCGGAGNPDPAFPRPDATTGVTGWDILDRVLVAPTAFDLMSYCDPMWIGAYSYTRMFRAAPSASAAMASGVPQRMLLLSGSLAPGRVTLHPVIETFTRATEQAAGGRYRLQGEDGSGRVLFDVRFEPASVGDGPVGRRHYALTVPIGANATLGRLRLTGPGLDTTVVAPAGMAQAAAATPAVTVTRPGAGRVRLQWDSARYPRLVVREGNDGAVLAIASGGDVTVIPGGGTLSLIFGGGLYSRTVMLTP